MKDPAGKPAPAGGFKTGGWYSGYQYWNGSFAPRAGEFHSASGKSGDAPTQSAADASFIQSERIKASQIQAPVNVPLPTTTPQNDFVTGLSAEVQNARAALESQIASQKNVVDKQATELRQKEQQTLGNIQQLSTPFRKDIEQTERDRLYVNQNFEANQTLTNELDTLLTQGNEILRQQQQVTGLASVRNPRIQKTMDDITARAGVIQAVMNARNGQISVAENMIDRTINAIAADRQDQISYYETVLQLDRQDIIKLDDVSRGLAEEQLNLKKNDLVNAQATVNRIKELLIDPNTAQLMAEAGVKLTDSVEGINSKLADATYAREVRNLSNEMVLTKGAEVITDTKNVPKNELRIITDSRGKTHYYRVPKETTVGTEGERSVSRVATLIAQNNLNFPDAVDAFANQLSLSDIYSAYAQSAMGQKYGLPREDPQLIAIQYKLSKGEITSAEAEAMIKS